MKCDFTKYHFHNSNVINGDCLRDSIMYGIFMSSMTKYFVARCQFHWVKGQNIVINNNSKFTGPFGSMDSLKEISKDEYLTAQILEA